MTAFFQRERFWRQCHFYSALLLTLQLLAWFSSGVVMTVLPIEQVRGEHLRKPAPSVDWQTATIAPAALASFQAEQITLTQQGKQPVYQLSRADQRWYINATTGTELQPLNEAAVRSYAQHWWQGHGAISQLQRLETPPAEVRGLTGPVWQVQFNDEQHSRFYLHPYTGELLRVRTDTWRLYDFFWMLHIMDYDERSDFNHALVIAASSCALLFVLSALPLLWFRSRRQLSRTNVS